MATTGGYSIEDVKLGQMVYVTSDFSKLKEEWKAAELGELDDKDMEAYCGCPGKITEIEDDDDTVQLEWLTKDTQWIPVAACVRDVPVEKRRDAPFQICEMVNEPQSLEYFTSIDEVKVDQRVYVTPDFKVLRKQWTECELGPISDEDLEAYCGCPGIVKEIEDDDDTVQVQWLTRDTQWIPICACVVFLEEKRRRDAPFQVCEMVNEPQPLDYFTNIDQAKLNDRVFVTTDLKTLRKFWTECELGGITDEDLEAYCGCPGIVKEIEDDDDTVQLEWLTKDTQWIPFSACVKHVEERHQKAAPFQVCEMINEPQPLEYFSDIIEANINETVYVTTDAKTLRKFWTECELGPISDEDLETYCGCPGKIKEVEDDDDTVMLEWLTKDTQWIPFCACVKDLDKKLRRDAPFQVCEMVNEPQQITYFKDIEQAEMGKTVYVTPDGKLLRKFWEACELGSITQQDLETYCGCPGRITEIEEDDDTVQLEWNTKDTQWIPICACTEFLEEKLRNHAPFQICEIVNEKAEAHDNKLEGDPEAEHELVESEVPVVDV